MKKLVLALVLTMCAIGSTQVQASELWEKKELPAVNAWVNLILFKAIPMEIYRRSEFVQIAAQDDSREGIVSLANTLDQVFTATYGGKRLKSRQEAVVTLANSLSRHDTAGVFAHELSRLYLFE